MTEAIRRIPKASELIGLWRLTAYMREYLDNGTKESRECDGYLCYSEGGTVMAMVVDRSTPAPLDEQLTDEERIRLWNGIRGVFAGRYSADEQGAVTHNITLSWNVRWNGDDHVRYATMEGDELVISTTPRANEIDGRMMVNHLRWVRTT